MRKMCVWGIVIDGDCLMPYWWIMSEIHISSKAWVKGSVKFQGIQGQFGSCFHHILSRHGISEALQPEDLIVGPHSLFYYYSFSLSLPPVAAQLRNKARERRRRSLVDPEVWGTPRQYVVFSGCLQYPAMGEWTILERLLEAAVQQHSTMIGR